MARVQRSFVCIALLLLVKYTLAWEREAPFTPEVQQIVYGNGVYIGVQSVGGDFDLLIATANESTVLSSPWHLTYVPGPDDSNGIELIFVPSLSKFAIVGWQSAITSTDGYTWSSVSRFAKNFFITVNPIIVQGSSIWSLDDTSYQPVLTTDLVHWTKGPNCGKPLSGDSAGTCFFGLQAAIAFNVLTGKCGPSNAPVYSQGYATGGASGTPVVYSQKQQTLTFLSSSDCFNWITVGSLTVSNFGQDYTLVPLGDMYYAVPLSPDEPIYTSLDLKNWQQLSANPPQLSSVPVVAWFYAGNYTFAAAGKSDDADDGTLDAGLQFYSSDGLHYSLLPTLNITFAVDIIEYQSALILLDSRGFLRSTDNGMSWALTVGNENNATYEFPFSVVSFSSDVTYLVAGNLQMISTDGQSWQTVEIDLGSPPPAPPAPLSCTPTGPASSGALGSFVWGAGTGQWLAAVQYDYTYCCKSQAPECEETTQVTASQILSGTSLTSLSAISLSASLTNYSSFVIGGKSDLLFLIVSDAKAAYAWDASSSQWEQLPISGLDMDSVYDVSWVGSNFFACGQSCWISPNGSIWQEVFTGLEDNKNYLQIRYSVLSNTYYATRAYADSGGKPQWTYSADGRTWNAGDTVPVLASAAIVAVTGAQNTLLTVDSLSGSLWRQ